MADVFGRETTFGAAISSDGTVVTFDDFRVGLLVQQLGLNYAQQITRIFELSSNRQYYVIGRPQGTMNMNRVVGPQQVTTQFINKFGQACNASNNTVTLTAKAGCLAAATTGQQPVGEFANGGINYNAQNVVLTQLSLSVASQDMLINEAFQAMFVGLVAGAVLNT